MTQNMLLVPIFLPLLAALFTLLCVKKSCYVQEIVALLATLGNLIVACLLFNQKLSFTHAWGGFGFDFSLRLYHFSAFIILAAAGFGFLITLYSLAFMNGKKRLNLYYTYLLLNLSFTNGAVLADNLVIMLFFWEGLLLAMFGFIALGGMSSMKTAIKAFVIVGVTDLCLMLGIAMTGYLAKTMTISQIHLSFDVLGSVAFILLMIGAISKAGSMPFHSWIPDAAVDAPLPFMAFIPAALEKLLGIYFLARISLDLFKLQHGTWVSVMLMSIGAITILLAVMMALVQKDYKRLLSFHAISQVGYMILGIGTAVPAGIIGGIFHMINHAMYKCCLFLTGGAVEKQTGTTSLSEIGGLHKHMPITFICFVVAAASISGVPPFNGFFSKELVYDGALESGWIFYAAALLGSVLTAASFLKLGHAAYFGKEGERSKEVKEAPWSMLLPMLVIAGLCVLFGVYNALPLNNLIIPILGADAVAGHHIVGWPTSNLLVILTCVALLLAVLNHWFGVKKSGSGLGASDHIHYAPVLHTMYDKAEKRWFDPYEIGMKLVYAISKLCWWIDRFIDFLYNKVVVHITFAFTGVVRALHNGAHATYLLWCLIGVALMVIYMLKN